MPPSTVFSYWRRDHRRAGVAPGQPQHQQQPQQVQQKQQPTSLPSKANSTDNPPQLPLIPNTPDLTASFGESPVISDSGGALGPEENNPPSWDQQHLRWDQNQSQTQSRDQDQEQSPSPSQTLNQADKLTAGVGSISSRAPTSSSATNLTVPSSSFEKQARPHSSPEEREKPSPGLTSQSNYSQSSFAAPRPDLSEGDSASSKQNSPFRLSFGKGITPSTEGPKPISTTATITGNSQSAASPSALSKANNSKSSPDVSPAEKPTIPPKDSKLDRSSSRRYADRDGSSDHAHHKSGKAMLHLLNPMSLLARRRSSRMAGSRADDVKIGAPNLVPAIPDDYDPRIRGNIVHDFSAPRPRRNLSAAPVPQDATGQTGSNDAPQNVTPTDPASQASEQQKTWHNEHPPAFKEHFEDDRQALQVENKGYLQSPLMMNPPTPDSEHTLPVFARKLPSKVPENEKEQPEKEQQQQQQQQQEQEKIQQQQQQQMEQEQEPEQEQQQEKQQNQSPLEQGQEQPIVNPETPPDSPQKDELPPVQDEEDTVVKMPQPPSGLPRHFKSNASRFSFDMTDMESSVQEKLLEEKHKEKEAERKAKYGPDDYSEDDDYDDLLDDMDDGLEEKIPGVNTDADEDDIEGFSGPGKVMSKPWFSPGLSPIIGSPASPIVPHMANMPVVPGAPAPNGLAQQPPFDASYFPPMNATAVPTDNTSAPQGIGAGEQQQPPTTAPKPVGENPGTSQQQQKQQADDDDDDLYFDDGEFGDLSVDTGGDAERFDESIFDDETSHLYERKKKQPAEPVVPAAPDDNKEQPEPKISSSSSDGEALGTTRQPSSHRVDLGHVPSMASEYRGAALKNYNSVSERTRDPRSAKAHGGVLSEHNLEALHNALTNAAVGGDRFEGNESISDQSLDQESAARTAQTTDSHPGLVSDNSRLSQGMDGFGSEEVYEDFDYDDADDSLYDDPIIAAANAEALENDDEGFYGEEFGFYAHSPGNNGTQLTNGGYFGAHGVEGISRNFSSRGKFREPSLTPITERSERSTRNSLISVTAQHGPAPHSSPGLAQLVDLGSNLDEEMSLSALMKLRRGAWGGSNSSLRSSSASPPPAPHPHSASNRASFTALSDASPTVPTIPADLIWPGSAAGSPVREAERNGSSTASPV